MEKGFEILWTDLALEELSESVEYLEKNFLKKKLTSWEMKLKELVQSYRKIQKFFLTPINYKPEKQ